MHISASGRKFTVNVESEETLFALKMKIMDEMGIPPNHQKMTFEGNTLTDDNASLASFGINNCSELELIPTMHGGCGCECCGCGCKCNIL